LTTIDFAITVAEARDFSGRLLLQWTVVQGEKLTRTVQNFGGQVVELFSRFRRCFNSIFGHVGDLILFRVFSGSELGNKWSTNDGKGDDF
jgi:hypothetical protein